MELNPLALANEPTKSRWSVATVPDYPPEDNISDQGSFSQRFNFKFEQDLSRSRVYRNITFHGSTSSLLTTNQPASRWSTISDLTVADVMSQMSVLNLAITASEVYKPQQYSYRLQPASSFSSHRSTAALPRWRARELLAFARPKLSPVRNSFVVNRNTFVVNEFCKKSGASTRSTCLEVLYLVLKTYLNLPMASKSRIQKSFIYALYVIHGDLEHCFGHDEQPLAIFDELSRGWKNPLFMIKKHEPPAVGYDKPVTIESVGFLTSGWWVSDEIFTELMANDPSVLGSQAMVYKLPGLSSMLRYTNDPNSDEISLD